MNTPPFETFESSGRGGVGGGFVHGNTYRALPPFRHNPDSEIAPGPYGPGMLQSPIDPPNTGDLTSLGSRSALAIAPMINPESRLSRDGKPFGTAGEGTSIAAKRAGGNAALGDHATHTEPILAISSLTSSETPRRESIVELSSVAVSTQRPGPQPSKKELQTDEGSSSRSHPGAGSFKDSAATSNGGAHDGNIPMDPLLLALAGMRSGGRGGIY